MSQFRSQNKPVQKKPTFESAFKAAGISLEQFKKDKEKMKKPCIEVEKKACAGKRGIKNKKHFYVSNISNDPISKPGFEFYYPGITYKEPLDLSGVQKKASSGVNSCTSEPPKIRSKGILVPNKNGFIYKKQQNREVPKNNGIKPALTTQPDNEAELIIGLDFGTSSVKVVIHDYQRDIFYAVPFYPAGNDHRFFFPTRVWLGTEGYSLDCGETLITDLKLPLMEPDVQSNTLIHAIAFLALIIRHARGWLLSRHEDIYKGYDILWGMNLGLPVEHSENNILTNQFRTIALSAINIASEDVHVITRENTEKYLVLCRSALEATTEAQDLLVSPDMVNVFPEIGAQVQAFIETESWDAKNRPFIFMADIGAGTLDMSIFSVNGKKDSRTFRFFKNQVLPYGVMNLHERRIGWFKEFCSDDIGPEAHRFLEQMTNEFIIKIPDTISGYFINSPEISSSGPDNTFFQECERRVYGVANQTKRNRIPLNTDIWKKLPFFLCGGGSRMQFYRRIVDEINKSVADRGIYLDLMSLERPDKLRAEGLADGDYDRLSVAYGLSFPEIGEIIPSQEISDLCLSDLHQREKPVDQTDDG